MATQKLNSTTYRISGENIGRGVVHKDDSGWSAKVYVRGELHRDLGTFKTRRAAIEMTGYYLDYEVR